MSVKYIFCISTGRCGTDYLSMLFSSLNDCSSYHEQVPRFNKEFMRDYLKGKTSLVSDNMQSKVETILTNKNKIYVDTSHVFIKSFGWELPKYISEEEIGVIILKRKRDEVSESIHRVGTGPFTEKGKNWIICPNKNALTKKPVGVFEYKFLNLIIKFYWKVKKQKRKIDKTYPKYFKKKSIEMIKWYYNETYALGEKFKKKFPKINYVEVELEELNTAEGFEKIISKFNLSDYYDKIKTSSLLGKRVNLKEHFITNKA